VGYTRIIRSGNIIEIYKYERPISPPTFRKNRIQAARNGNIRTPKKRRSDNCYRLRKNFRRICDANLTGDEIPSFLTLTMHQIVSLSRAVVYFSGFVRRLRKRIGNDFRYIAVPEFQKRGAVHFHVLIWGLPDGYVDEISPANTQTITIDCLKEANSRVLQNIWGYGYVDCFRTDGSPKLSGYMSKYMSKHMQDLRLATEKAYYCSRNIMRPMSYGSNTVGMWLEELVPVDNSMLATRTYDVQYAGRCHYQKLRVN